MAGVELPITTHALQAFVTEPLKPFLHTIIVSATLHVYISQTDRGEVLIGSEIEPYTVVQPGLDAGLPGGRRRRTRSSSSRSWAA